LTIFHVTLSDDERTSNVIWSRN